MKMMTDNDDCSEIRWKSTMFQRLRLRFVSMLIKNYSEES